MVGRRCLRRNRCWRRFESDLLSGLASLFTDAADWMTATGALGGPLLAEPTSVRTTLLAAAALSLVLPVLCAASPLARARLPAAG